MWRRPSIKWSRTTEIKWTKKNLQIKSNQKKEEQSEEKSGSFIFKISGELQWICKSENLKEKKDFKEKQLTVLSTIES